MVSSYNSATSLFIIFYLLYSLLQFYVSYFTIFLLFLIYVLFFVFWTELTMSSYVCLLVYVSPCVHLLVCVSFCVSLCVSPMCVSTCPCLLARMFTQSSWSVSVCLICLSFALDGSSVEQFVCFFVPVNSSLTGQPLLFLVPHLRARCTSHVPLCEHQEGMSSSAGTTELLLLSHFLGLIFTRQFCFRNSLNA